MFIASALISIFTKINRVAKLFFLVNANTTTQIAIFTFLCRIWQKLKKNEQTLYWLMESIMCQPWIFYTIFTYRFIDTCHFFRFFFLFLTFCLLWHSLMKCSYHESLPSHTITVMIHISKLKLCEFSLYSAT